jgi:hypothetical protein
VSFSSWKILLSLYGVWFLGGQSCAFDGEGGF